ncbi:MAG: aromatic hydrocarbon degradation protein [Ginsengibacter sp.]
MKKIILGLLSLTLCNLLYAQEPADVLRLGYTNGNGGTARNQAIGGAGASLGGEFSSLFINPAGLGFYKTGDLVFTPGYSFKNNKSTYLGNSGEAKNNNFNMGASGVVFSSPTRSNSIPYISIALGINKTADFNNQIYYKGLNKSSSYSQKYIQELKNANATDPGDVAKNFPETSSLAFNTFLINPVFSGADSAITGYKSVVNPALGITQENNISTTGGITDLSLGAGANVADKWYFGGSLSLPIVTYDRRATYSETDASGDPQVDFNYFKSSETLSTKGMGVNGKLGIIYKPVESVRFGLAVHTPTFYQLTDNWQTRIETGLKSLPNGFLFQNSTDLDITKGYPLETRYNVTTPWKLMASGTFIFNQAKDVQQQRGFLTADVEYVNYGSMAIHDGDNNPDAKTYYSQLNQVMKNLYKDAVNVRIGSEVKFNTLMVRLGGAYYGNPYKNQDANVVKVSGGLGYRNRGMFIDLTYVQSMTKDINYPYQLEGTNNVPAFLKNNGGSIMATIGFKI